MDARAADGDRRRALRGAAQGAARGPARQHRRARRDGDESTPARAASRFYLHPGSGLAKKRPKWVLAAELVETTRLFARCAAKIEPEWIEEVAGDRVTRDYFEPHWDETRGEVVASERVQLYGLTLVARRPVSFGAHRSGGSRARCSSARRSCPARCATQGAFLAHNRALVAEVAELEHKARRQDVLVDDETIARVLRRARSGGRRIRSRRSSAGARTPSAAIRRCCFMTREA